MLKDDNLIYGTASVKDALKKLDKISEKVLVVVDADRRLLGTITDGDVRRYILKGKPLDRGINGLYNERPRYLTKAEISPNRLKEIFVEKKIALVPVVDDSFKVIDFIAADGVLFDSERLEDISGKVNVPVVVMAGGRGTRLEPFSKIFPKALIPIGDVPIIEIIINEFRRQGVRDFFISLNHKGEMIEAYFNNIEKDYKIAYIREDDFLGTAGSLKFLEDEIGDTFIVSNCDVMVKANFEEVLHFHRDQNASFTVLSSIQHHKIPYGVVKFKEGGEVTEIIEKPEYSFPINTGAYLVNRDALKFMPKGSHFDMTDLINVLIENGRKVITYPVNESDYADIGQWEEYHKAMEKMRIA